MNATQRALLKAIAANPHDDAPRLVYADWLDEHAAELPKKEREATAARAEIIRVQCELARLAEEDSESRWVYEYLQYSLSPHESYPRVDWAQLDPVLGRYITLHLREQELRKLHEEKWKADELRERKGASFGLRRGFWTYLSISGAVKDVGRLISALEKRSDSIPLSELNCDRELTPAEAKRLAESEIAKHLVAVGGDLQRPILYTALAQAKVAPNIRQAGPSCYYSDYLLPFARSAKWGALRTLWVVSHGDARLTSLEPLAEAKHLASLQRLFLYLDAGCLPSTIEAVANGPWKDLRRLDFDAWLRDQSARTLSKGSGTKQLRYISLGHKLRGSGVTAVLTSPGLNQLVVVALKGDLRGLNAGALKKAVRPHLRVLDVPVVAKPDLMALANSPATRNLQILTLGSGLTNGAMKSFLRAMRMPQLTVLNIEHSEELGPATAEAIAACDRLGNLQAINLMWTKIGNEGAKALAKSKHLTKLRYIGGAHQAGITASGLAALRKRFGEDVVRG